MADILIATQNNSEVLSVLKAESIFTVHAIHDKYSEHFQIALVLSFILIVLTNTFLIRFILQELIFSLSLARTNKIHILKSQALLTLILLVYHLTSVNSSINNYIKSLILSILLYRVYKLL